MKNLKMLSLCLSVFISTNIFVYAESSSSTPPISYIILNEASTSTVKVTQNNYINKSTYSCEVSSYICSVISTSTTSYVASSSKEIYLQGAIDFFASTTQRLASTSEQSPLFSMPVSVPKDASYVTFATSSATTTDIAFYTSTGNYGIKDNRIYWVLFADKNKKPIYFSESIKNGWDLVADLTKLFNWSADGNKLTYISDRSGYTQLYMVDLLKNPNTADGVQVTYGNQNITDSIIVGDYLYYVANPEKTYEYNLYRVNLNSEQVKFLDKKSKQAKQVKKGDIFISEKVFSDVSYANDMLSIGDNVIFTKNNKGVGELWGYNTKDSKSKIFEGITYEKLLTGKTEVLNKKELKGYFLESATSTESAIIWLHGGPYRQSAGDRHSYGSYAVYDWILEEARKSGVSVLKLDYPGSSGYGSAYANSIVSKVGDIDVQNVEKAKNYLKKKGYKKIYLFGASYGAYLALKSGADLGDSISGAVAVAPVTDWEKLINDVSPTPFEVHFKGSKNASNTSLYDTASVLKSVNSNTAPLTIIHGDKDNQVPYSQSMYFIKESIAKGVKNIKMISLKDEKHILRGVSQLEAVCKEVAKMSNYDVNCKLK